MSRPILGRVSAAALLVGSLFGASAWASPPVTLTDANTAANPVTYSAGPYFVRTADAGCQSAGGQSLCDDTPLTVNVSSAAAGSQRVVVRIDWPEPVEADFDLYVLQGPSAVTASASTTDPEVARMPATNGLYTVHVVPYQPYGQSFTAHIYLEPLPNPPAATSGPVASYQVFAPPDGSISGGEPSIGANWKTGTAVVGNSSDAAFITFDDSTSPATAKWENRPPLSNAISFDPILFTDRETGRTLTSQLVSDATVFAAGCSLSSYTDDDGMTWIPTEGCGPPAGADHQGMGGGPYAPPLSTLPPNPAYGHAVYYCAQSVGAVLGDATCSRSDDGGLTYGPGVLAYTSECGGLHGHPRVAPDGTVYLPNRDCAGTTGLGQGVVISTDNGLSWSVSTVPGTTPGASDPSVAAGLTDSGKPAGQGSNTVYLGMCDGDGRAKVAMSHDQGVSWSNAVDVGAAAGIKNCVFPEMIAGDDDRAAIMFLGTGVGGPFQGKTFAGEWHAYVATTYDAGKTWGLADVTPNDPVQIGCIWMQGGSNPCRNLLDFNDITLDKQGRPLFVFADGCIAPKCGPGSRATASRRAVDTVGRQSGCKTLFSAYDKTAGSNACGQSAPPAKALAAGSDPAPLAGGPVPLTLLAPLLAVAALRRRRLNGQS